MTILTPENPSADKIIASLEVPIDARLLTPNHFNQPLGINHVDVSYGSSNTEMLSRLRPFRAQFVEKMNWRPHHDSAATEVEIGLDADIYDSYDETLHLSSMDRQSGEIMAALRLTPVDSVQDSLSWSMFKNNLEMQQHAYEHRGGRALESLNGGGNLWDLTRLVHPYPVPDEHAASVAGSMMELFGVAHGIIKKTTPGDEHEDIRWFFTTTEELKNHLLNLGINLEVITKGVINPELDKGPSYFCTVAPESNVRLISDNPHIRDFTYAHMVNGLEKANAL